MAKRTRKTKEKTLDFRPIGENLKRTRLKHKLTREDLCSRIDIDVRYLTAIENEGHSPSLEVFYRIIHYFGLSADQFFYPNDAAKTNSVIKIERLLPALSERDAEIIYKTVQAMLNQE